MSFEAKFAGWCDSCDEPIVIGDPLKYDGDELVHDGCDVPSLLNPRDAVCQECWLIHAGGCYE